MRADTAWSQATIRATSDLTPGIRLIEIVPEGGAVRWSPGSHIDVGIVVDGRAATRSYSLIGEPDPSCYRIAVRREDNGRGGSRAMWTLTQGARLTVSTPNNLFELELDRPEYLLVAGGIGITPILGMAIALDRRGANVRLAYAGRSRGEMPFLSALAERLGDRLAVHAADEGRRLDLAATFAALGPGAEAYVCGPMRLLDAARRAWAVSGRPATALRYETFGSSGRHAPEPFRVRVPRHGVDLVVPETRTLLEALSEAGVDVMWDCRRGECGLCALDVLEVAGEIDHRDVFFSEHEKRENHKICACVSRAVGGELVLDTAYRGDEVVR